MYCKNQINTVIWWRSTKFRHKSFILLSLATKREIWKSESIRWKTTWMRSYWYQNFEDPTIHVTVATDAKFWGLKFQNRFTHAKLRGRDLVFRYCPIIRTCSFTWTGWNNISPTPYKFPVLFRPRANTFDMNHITFIILLTDAAKLPRSIFRSQMPFLNWRWFINAECYS